MISYSNEAMAQILVRDIDGDDVKERLQRRAARHGRSMEAEVRDILRDSVKEEDQPGGNWNRDRFPSSEGLASRIGRRFRSCAASPFGAPSRNHHPRHQRHLCLHARYAKYGRQRCAGSTSSREPRSGRRRSRCSEIRFGLEIMPDGRRLVARREAFDRLIAEKLERRVAPFDTAAARETATLMGARQRRGEPRDLRDSMIAGIVLARRATLATRNLRHFNDLGLDLVDPWRP